MHLFKSVCHGEMLGWFGAAAGGAGFLSWGCYGCAVLCIYTRLYVWRLLWFIPPRSGLWVTHGFFQLCFVGYWWRSIAVPWIGDI